MKKNLILIVVLLVILGVAYCFTQLTTKKNPGATNDAVSPTTSPDRTLRPQDTVANPNG